MGMGFGGWDEEDPTPLCHTDKIAQLNRRNAALEQELRLAKAAAAEWISKYEQAEKRIDVVWDLALHEARMRIGHHNPPCFSPCFLCFSYAEIGKMMRVDHANYVPVKERLRQRAAELSAACKLPDAECDAYSRGIAELLAFAEKFLADRE